MAMEKEKVALSTKIYYGFGSVAYGVKNNGFNYFLLAFYSQVMGLRPSIASLALLIALIFDAISDPLVGYISDNWHSRWSRRHPFMYFSAVPVSLGYFFLWNPPSAMSDTALFWYLVVLAIAVRTCITLYEIPSTALVSELTEDYDQRTSMLSFRYFFGWYGGLTMAVMAWLVFLRPTEKYPIGFLNPEGWHSYGKFAAVLIFVAIMVSSIGTHKHIPYLKKPPAKTPISVRRTLGELIETLSNPSFLALFITILIWAFAGGIEMSLNVYFNKYFWNLTEAQISLIPISNFFSAILALILATRLTARRDKKKILISTFLFAVIFGPIPICLRLMGFFPENGHPVLLPILVIHSLIHVTVVIMVGIFISSMIADLVEDSERKTGRRSEGLFFAAHSFSGKAVNGFGILGAGLILELIRFPVKTASDKIDPQVLTNMGLVFVPVVVIFYLFSIYSASFYRITRAKHSENLERLSKD
jgi:glycoside/pentoside/hexuronide:cation symporter, GPH family